MNREVTVVHVHRFAQHDPMVTVDITADHMTASIGRDPSITLFFDDTDKVREFALQLTKDAHRADEAPPVDAPEGVSE